MCVHVIKSFLITCTTLATDDFSMILLASNFLDQWYLTYWPEEHSYSKVQPSKLVEPKKPAIRDKVRVKDGTKVNTGPRRWQGLEVRQRLRS